MATDGAEDLDYESDPEEVKRSLTMRRREASDDEDESSEKPREGDRRAPIHSDDSDGQGGAGEYDEEIDEEELGLEDEEEEEIDEELQEAYEESREISRQRAAVRVEGSEDAVPKEIAGDEEAGEEQAEGSQVDGEEKKEHEPFAVPTAGAFYMHDDRFRDSSGGRGSRRMPGGKKLWESRDDKKWGHDKFEEVAHHDRGYQEGRSSRGHVRGRGRNRGGDRGGYGRGSKPRVYDNVPDQSQGPKNVRGKGTRKYEPAAKTKTQQPSMQNRQASRSNEKPLNTNSARTFTATNHAEFEPASSRKNVFASSLNSASPPFYPSASSNNSYTQKREGQVGNSNRNFRQSTVDNSSMRGKNIADSENLEKLKINDTAAKKSLGDLSNSVNTAQFRGHGRPAAPAQMTYQPVNHNQAVRGSLPAAPHGANRGPSHGRGQKSNGSQPSSPPKTSLSTTYNPVEVDSVSEANMSKTAIVAKGKGAVQGSGRGSVMYNGAQVVGTAGMGDQNFPGAPTFLPVMQFGGQHPPGMGVPAVGMAFPGYVGQQGIGLGNSEMTWLPVLAGAAGAYCPPYITVDGAYHPRPSGPSTSGSGPSKENNTTTKPNTEWKSSQRPEIVSDEFGQRQNKPRRYSEMNFGQ